MYVSSRTITMSSAMSFQIAFTLWHWMSSEPPVFVNALHEKQQEPRHSTSYTRSRTSSSSSTAPVRTVPRTRSQSPETAPLLSGVVFDVRCIQQD